MPWVHGDDYMQQTNAELKNLLLLRYLPHSGTKAKKASRLVEHDKKQSVHFSAGTLTSLDYLLMSHTVLSHSRNSHLNFET